MCTAAAWFPVRETVDWHIEPFCGASSRRARLSLSPLSRGTVRTFRPADLSPRQMTRQAQRYGDDRLIEEW